MNSIDTALEYRDAIEHLFLDQAKWHDVEAVASERPEDLRHERSAEALRKATVLLHEWSPYETDLQYFAQFAGVLERTGLDPDPELVLRHSTGAARRFSYDIEPPDVSDCEVLRLVEDIFNDAVESYEGTIFAAIRDSRSP